MRRQDTPLWRRHGGDLLTRPVIDRSDLVRVGGCTHPVVRSVSRIKTRQRSGDVAHVNHAVAWIEPGVLVDCRRKLPAGNRMLLFCSQSLHIAGDHHLGAGKVALLEERLQPRFEFFIEIVDEDGASPGDCRDIGWGRLVQLAIPAGADDRHDVDTVATDLTEHIGDNAETRDHRDPVCGRCRAGQQQRGEHDTPT